MALPGERYSAFSNLAKSRSDGILPKSARKYPHNVFGLEEYLNASNLRPQILRIVSIIEPVGDMPDQHRDHSGKQNMRGY
jgi:hypothetical protein